MLIKPPIEKLLPRVANRYILAMVTAKRARQLVDGAQPMVDNNSQHYVSLAAEELAEDEIMPVPAGSEVTVPLRPEIELARQAAEREEEEKRREEMMEENRRQIERAVTREKEAAESERDADADVRAIAEQLIRIVSEEDSAAAEQE